MNKEYIIAVDQSTSSSKAILFGKNGLPAGRVNVPHKQYYRQPGWVEHDAEEIYRNVVEAILRLIRETNVPLESVAALAITNQRETTVLWNRYTGKPIAYADVWQSQRAAAACEQLQQRSDEIYQRTGLFLSPNFSAAKAKWLLDNTPGARNAAEKGDLLMGTIDSWLVWKLTGGSAHVTDYTNACRTQLFNIKTLEWDKELLKLFQIPVSMLPKVKSSNQIFGETDMEGKLPMRLPISGIMGDSNGALFGQNCFLRGDIKVTYGTGTSVMMNVGDAPIFAGRGALTSIAWGMDGRVEYVLDGNITCTGGTIQWLKDELEMVSSAAECDKLAQSVADHGGVYLVPAFSGLGAPYWSSDARAAIVGMTLQTTKAHVIRAALESIAYQIQDALEIVVNASGIHPRELRVDGGPTRNEFLMQFQADLTDIPVARNTVEELSAQGVAYMAGLAVGLWKNREDIARLRQIDRRYEGAMTLADRTALCEGWKKAVQRVLL